MKGSRKGLKTAKLTSKERLLRAIRHEEVDRIAISPEHGGKYPEVCLLHIVVRLVAIPCIERRAYDADPLVGGSRAKHFVQPAGQNYRVVVLPDSPLTTVLPRDLHSDVIRHAIAKVLGEAENRYLGIMCLRKGYAIVI